MHHINDLTQITVDELKLGDIALVRSHNVQEFGDHYIIVVGPLVVKPHGIRPETVTVPLELNGDLMFDHFKAVDGVILLRLEKKARQEFIDFQNLRASTLAFFNNSYKPYTL